MRFSIEKSIIMKGSKYFIINHNVHKKKTYTHHYKINVAYSYRLKSKNAICKINIYEKYNNKHFHIFWNTVGINVNFKHSAVFNVRFCNCRRLESDRTNSVLIFHLFVLFLCLFVRVAVIYLFRVKYAHRGLEVSSTPIYGQWKLNTVGSLTSVDV